MQFAGMMGVTCWMAGRWNLPRRVVIATSHDPLIEANAELTGPLAEAMYVHDVVFSTGIVDAVDHFIVASSEADLPCRNTHIAKASAAFAASAGRADDRPE
jgi:hypothetical protein